MKARRRPRPLLTVGLVASLLGPVVPTDAYAQFNPAGRKKPTAKPTGPAPGRAPSARPRTEGAPPKKTPASPAPSPGASDDDKSQGELLTRYTEAALNQPGAEFPIRRLAELARARDGNLDRLLRDFEQRANAEGPRGLAAAITLGGLYEQAGRRDDARRAYETARAKNPRSTLVDLALGRLAEKSGDKAGAREAYGRALPRLTGAERELTLRAAMRLALDEHAFDEASRLHAELTRAAHGSAYVQAELGRELLARGEAARAVTELRKVATAARGDNRALAPALRDLGAALLAAGDVREALQVLGRAQAAAAGQPGLAREIDELSVEAHRREGRLPELISALEKKGNPNAERLRLLGRLYEETGDVERALASYRRALTKAPADVETRLKVVRLLELQGELDEAVRQYDELLRRSPGDASLVFRFAELLLQRGERARALTHLERLERAARGDEDTAVALIDFYERIGEEARAARLLAALVSSGVRDPGHLVELGSRHYRDGKPDEAKRIWRRVLTVERDRTRALVTLGEVLLDHDFPDEALESLREAVSLRPTDTRARRSLALALERIGATKTDRAQVALFDEARAMWEELLAGHSRGIDAPSRRAAQEARQHIVKLWQRTGQLGARRNGLAERTRRKPPDLEAARLLAEAELLARDYAAAERTLTLLTTAEPGDVASLGALERVLSLQGKREDAIGALKRLVQADPAGAREYYQRMARHAAEDYQDARAVQYAVKAVELNPDDARGHQRLAEMYRQRGEHELAIASYRQAIAKNDRLYPAYFALAELLLGRGKDEEADLWLRRALRTAPDDELVSRATRLSLEINLARRSVDKLEADLLPLALGQPKRPLYRRLLLEVYGAEAYPLVHRAQSSSAADQAAARAELARLGERAIRPLLDSLGDERVELQRTALSLLSHLQTRGAGTALLSYAAGEAPEELREQAVVTVAKGGDARLLPKLEALVFDARDGDTPRQKRTEPPARGDAVAIAAAWAGVRLRTPEAAALALRLTKSEVSEQRALGALGLGRAQSEKEVVRALTLLSEIATTPAQSPVPRAAAAHSLGELLSRSGRGGKSVEAGERAAEAALVSLLDASDGLVRDHALWALARTGNAHALRALAEALVSDDARARSVALAAAAAYGDALEPAREGPLDVMQDEHLDVRALLETSLPRAAAPEAAVRALVRLEDALQAAALLAVRTSSERAEVVARALTAREGKPAFGALTAHLDDVPEELQKDAERAARAVTVHAAPAYLDLTRHGDAKLRAASIAALGLLPDHAEARAAVEEALGDPAPSVQDAALAALGRGGPAQRAVLVRVLESSKDWRLRHRAASALGASLAEGAPSDEKRLAVGALERTAARDPSHLVRDTASAALERATKAAARRLDQAPPPPLK